MNQEVKKWIEIVGYGMMMIGMIIILGGILNKMENMDRIQWTMNLEAIGMVLILIGCVISVYRKDKEEKSKKLER